MNLNRNRQKEISLEDLQKLISTRARSSRLYSCLTQMDLSKMSGVSYSSIRKFESTGEISLSSLLKIAEALRDKQSFTEVFSNATWYDIRDIKDINRSKRYKVRKNDFSNYNLRNKKSNKPNWLDGL